MDKPYFVILKHPNAEYILALVDDDGLIQFATKEDAKDAAKTSFLGDEIGYEIFDFRDPA